MLAVPRESTVCEVYAFDCELRAHEATWTVVVVSVTNTKKDSVLPKNIPHAVSLLPFSRVCVFSLTLRHTQRYAKGMQCMTYETFLVVPSSFCSCFFFFLIRSFVRLLVWSEFTSNFFQIAQIHETELFYVL